MLSRRDTLAPFGLSEAVVTKAEAERTMDFPQNWVVWVHFSDGRRRRFEAPEAARLANALRRLGNADGEAAMIDEAVSIAQSRMRESRGPPP